MTAIRSAGRCTRHSPIRGLEGRPGRNTGERAALQWEVGHAAGGGARRRTDGRVSWIRSEEHTSELQSLMRISYAVFCLKKNTTQNLTTRIQLTHLMPPTAWRRTTMTRT